MKFLSRAAAVASFSVMAAFAQAAPVDLGGADDYTMLAVGTAFDTAAGGFLQLGSEAQIYGNVGARRILSTAAGVKIHGNADGGFHMLSADTQVSGQTRSLSDSDWQGLYDDLASASATAASMSGVNFTNLYETTTFDAYSNDISVFNIEGELRLETGETLTLSGSSNDQVVVNVGSNFELGSGAAILLDGLLAENVLFNFTGGGFAEAAVLGGAEFSGTYIAPNMDWIIGDGATMDDTRVLVSGSIANVQDVNGKPPTTVTKVPEPGTWILMLLSLFGLRALRR